MVKTAQLFFLLEMGLGCEFQEFICQRPTPPPLLKLFHIPVPLPYYTLKIRLRFRTNYYCINIDMKHWTLHI